MRPAMFRMLWCALALAGALLAGVSRAAQTPAAAAPPADLGDLLPPVPCSRLSTPVRVDGVLDDEAWRAAPGMTRLVQLEPYNGAAPSESTWVWFAYDDEALYVAARMWDAHPDSIVAPFFRRDDFVTTDFAGVILDPFHDHRSGYEFIVTPAGSMADATRSNDANEDMSWDGVWEARTRRDPAGWTAEFRIPFSQMRFSRAERQVWGVDFGRCIARHLEKDFTAVPPKSDSRFEEWFPHLVGIERVRAGHHVELSPYANGKAQYLAPASKNPLFDASRYTPAGGADVRAGVGSNLTLNATINPDFGQVEVDPALVNLSDVESFYQEKRPFFTENAHVFTFGQDGATSHWSMNWPEPTFFYSRRIGRTPQTVQPDDPAYANVPVATRILGAAKLTGQPAKGWNLGVLQAITSQERADLWSGGAASRPEIEPLTWYGVARAQREDPGGRDGLGLFSTLAQRRFGDGGRLADELNRQSLLGGLDGWHFLDAKKVWVVSGWSAVSRVAGTEERMRAVQTGSIHYFQRPDAGYLGVKDVTSLTGYAGRLAVNKEQGAVQFNSALGLMDPSFDVSDVGYQSYADLINASLMVGYEWQKPNRWQTQSRLYGYTAGNWDFGGVNLWSEVGATGQVRFVNHQFLWGEVDWFPQGVSDRRTRGGPRMLNPACGSLSLEFDTDDSRPLVGTISASFTGMPGYRASAWSLSPSVTWKPAPRVRLSVGPSYERNLDDEQFVESVPTSDPLPADFGGRRYVFARLDQTTIGAGVRLNITFTRDLTLQTYVQPYLSAGRYYDYKELARAGSYDFVHYGRDPGTSYVGGVVTPAGGGTPFPLADQSFNYTSLRGNAVLRWEYRPGSALYLVWTQERSLWDTDGELRLGRFTRRLLDTPADDIFLVKVTYYLDL